MHMLLTSSADVRAVMTSGWKGNRGFGVALATHHWLYCTVDSHKLAPWPSKWDHYLVGCRIIVHVQQVKQRVQCNKKHLKNVGPIRHCEPPHAACSTLPFTGCRYCRTPPAHRCPQQHQQRQQRQRPIMSEMTLTVTAESTRLEQI